MRRLFLLIPIMAAPWTLARAQENAPGPAQALGITRSMSIPLNGVQLYDQVLEAWTWTFGKEPGATLLRSSRELGVLEGSARVNFRSMMLVGREESMGTITYHIHFQVRPGECRAVISQFVHTGNANTARGGIHLGRILRDEAAVTNVRGLSHGNTVQLHAEVRVAVTTRIETLLRTMESRIRANVEP
jgi:hypothetical protein